MRLEGRSALVTGGSRGIGRAIAMSLAQEGADVAVSYVERREAAERVVGEINGLDRRATALAADISDEEAATGLVDRAAAFLGKLDLLVNNAGMSWEQGRLVADSDPNLARRVMEVNFLGSYYCTRAALPHLRQHGRADIIFISSTGTKHWHAGNAPYIASKAAMEALARCLAREEQPNNMYYGSVGPTLPLTETSGQIRVNVVAPTLTETEMAREVVQATGRELSDVYAELPFGRMLQPEEVGQMVVFLASEGAYISGEVIYMDGARF